MAIVNSYYKLAIINNKYMLIGHDEEKTELPIGQLICDVANHTLENLEMNKVKGEFFNALINEPYLSVISSFIMKEVQNEILGENPKYMDIFIYENFLYFNQIHFSEIESVIESGKDCVSNDFMTTEQFFSMVKRYLYSVREIASELLQYAVETPLYFNNAIEITNKAIKVVDNKFDTNLDTVEFGDTQYISFHLDTTEFGIVGFYKFAELLSTIYFDLANCIQNKTTIKKCPNCNKYFVVTGRSNSIYCDNQAPQDESKTCKEYGSQKAWEDSLKNNECLGLARNIYMSKQMIAKRNPDIKEYKEAFEEYKIQNKQWKLDIKKGIKTEQEFLEWLKDIKEKKV